MALYKEHEYSLIWRWQCDLAGLEFLFLQKQKTKKTTFWHSCPLGPSLLCRSVVLSREIQESLSQEALLIGDAAFGGSCALLQGDGPFLPSEG